MAQEVFLFQPTSVPGCQLWLDAADSSVFTLSGSNVLQWNDKSGNSRNAIPRDNTKLPTRYLGFNQRFTVESSSDSTFGTPLLVNIASSNVQGPTGMSFFMAFKFISGTVFTQYESPRIISFEGSNRFDYGESNTVYTPGGYTNTVNSIVNLNINVSANNLDFRFQGSSLLSTTPSLVTTQFTTTIGIFGRGGASTNVPAQGQISEYIIYNQTLSTNQRQQIEGYLAWKWGLQGNLPSTHPFKTYRPLANQPIPPQVPNMPIITQNTSVFNPTQISGCQLWLDGADVNGNGTTPVAGSSIATWVDKTTNKYNMTQLSVGTQPTYNIYNSYPGLYFNGSQYLTNSTLIQSGTGGRTTFFVFYDVGTSPSGVGRVAGIVTLNLDTFGAGQGWSVSMHGSLNYLGVDTFGAAYIVSSNNPTVTNMRGAITIGMVGIQNSSTVGSIYSFGNGIQFNTTVASGSTSTAINTAGTGTAIGALPALLSTWNTNAYVYEIIHYNNALTTAQRQQVEGYLAWKWGLIASLPAGHPYKTQPIVPFPFRSTPLITNAVAWLPSRIPSLQLWFDGADLSTITLSGTNVTQWNDKSGNGCIASQGTTAKQATWSTSGVQFTASAWYNITGTTYTQTHSMIYVGTPTTAPGYVLGRNPATGGGPAVIGGFVGTSLEYYDYSQRYTIQTTPSGTYIAGYTRRQGGNIQGYYNTVLQFTQPQTYDNGTATGWPYINSTYGDVYADHGNWRLSEIILYNIELTNLQRQQVEGYLAWKWGLVGNLPASHPYKLFPPPPG